MVRKPARVIAALLTPLVVWLATVSGYLAALTVAALRPEPALPPVGPARRRFAILVTARDEELLVERLLGSLRLLDYPADQFTVHVAADNCRDATAALARAMRVRVYERHDPRQIGKGFALHWLLEQIAVEGAQYDAFVVLDADSVVTPNLLRSLDARLEAGSRMIQVYYGVLNRQAAPSSALRYAAVAALHYLRPLGRARLGLSVGLRGNGMCFAAALLQEVGWPWHSLVEDREAHCALVRAGQRVDFAPEAAVFADMPLSLRQAAPQNARWERGRLELLTRELPNLLVSSFRRRSWLPFDAAVEELVPPLSVLVALSGGCLVVGLARRAVLPVILTVSSLIVQAIYLLVSLVLVGAPRSVYRSLIYAPFYICWKLALYVQALCRINRPDWVRTER